MNIAEIYRFERITPNDFEDIQSLYLMSFGIEASIEALRIKYDTREFELSDIGYIARDNESNPAAYYGVFPIRLRYNNQNVLVAQSGDTMTAPQHQKKGLFTELAKKTFQLAEQSGVQLIFGFPNEQSKPGFERKLNWQFEGAMNVFELSVLTLPFCELSTKLKWLENSYEKYVRLRLKKYIIKPAENNLNGFNFSEKGSCIDKSLAFFDYKLNRPGVFLIRYEGFDILLKASVHLYIGEVAHHDSFDVSKLLIAVRKLARKLGCKKTIFTFSENHWMHNLLSSQMKGKISLPIGFYKINGTIELNNIQFSGGDYDTF